MERGIQPNSINELIDLWMQEAECQSNERFFATADHQDDKKIIDRHAVAYALGFYDLFDYEPAESIKNIAEERYGTREQQAQAIAGIFADVRLYGLACEKFTVDAAECVAVLNHWLSSEDFPLPYDEIEEAFLRSQGWEVERDKNDNFLIVHDLLIKERGPEELAYYEAKMELAEARLCEAEKRLNTSYDEYDRDNI